MTAGWATKALIAHFVRQGMVLSMAAASGLL